MAKNRKLMNSQLNNFATYQLYKNEMLTMAKNVYKIVNLPFFCDENYIDNQLILKGRVAFFIDEVLGLIALPFRIIGKLDVFGRPLKIRVMGQNGYNRVLNYNEFVIMYDNNGYYPIYWDILQFAERIANDTRTADININQQKTPRFWKTSQDNKKSLEDLIANVDSNIETIATYENLLTDDTTIILQPAPFVADKIDEHKARIWNEFLRFIGVANVSIQKKERLITDEVDREQGGTIVSRFSRYTPRLKAITEINNRWADKLEKPLELMYYDNFPNSQNDKEGEIDYDISNT